MISTIQKSLIINNDLDTNYTGHLLDASQGYNLFNTTINTFNYPGTPICTSHSFWQLNTRNIEFRKINSDVFGSIYYDGSFRTRYGNNPPDNHFFSQTFEYEDQTIYFDIPLISCAFHDDYTTEQDKDVNILTSNFKSVNDNITIHSFTKYGVTFTARKFDVWVLLTSSGSTSQTLATSSTFGTLNSGFRPCWYIRVPSVGGLNATDCIQIHSNGRITCTHTMSSGRTVNINTMYLTTTLV